MGLSPKTTPTQSNRPSTSSTRSKESEKSNVIRATVSSYIEYKNFIHNYDKSRTLYIFYCATNSPNSGYSWSENCNKALPLIEQAMKHVGHSIFLNVSVGLQDDWVDKSNPYRKDKCIKLKVLPTLHKYKTYRRLEGEYCLNPELLELLFEQDSEDSMN